MRFISDFHQPATTRLVRAALATLLAAALLAVLPAAALATATLSWSPATAFDSHGAPTAVTCVGESLCVAVDEAGDVWTSASARSPAWTLSAQLGGEHPLTAVSCASVALCVAVDRRGDAFVSTRPASGGWSRSPIDGTTALTALSCPSTSLCVAVDEAGNVLTSTNPAAGAWTASSVDPGHALTAVSCYSQSLCVALDDAGQVLSSTEPTGGATHWPGQRVDFGALLAISCPSAAPAPMCVAVDADGDVLASEDPGASAANALPAATWSVTPISDERLTGVSCGASSLCVVVDGRGEAWASDDPQAPSPAWAPAGIDSHALVSVWCLPGGSCDALDSGGSSLWARVPALSAITLAPAQASSSSASLAGEVDPWDAVLQTCAFEFGSGAAGSPYTQSVPCAASPPAGGGAVSALLSGLTPNTTYHYRVLASTAAETSAGADTTFTTGISSQIALVTPSPSIAGTPAPGQRLTCKPGTPAGASVKLGYAWLRDQIAIPEQASSSYMVKNQDSGHHLQCQVTATDGGGSATARSGFVTVPSGGVPASVGETTVGRASVAGLKVSVPIGCSPRAGGGCQIALRVTTEVRRKTLTLASSRAHIAAGAHVTASATVGAAGKRLLASLRHLSAEVYVAGTVIGVIEAQLSRQLVTFSAPVRHAARKTGGRASRRRSSGASARGARSSATSPAAARASSVLAATPYMGWDTYFALGGNFSESTILSQASQLISLGLAKRGYRYVWLDVGWWHGTRAADGEITVSPKQWPHGLAWLTRTLHAAGLLVGLYTDAGPDGCGGAGEGSYGHYQQDVNTFAAWGFDAVKVDFCGGAEHGLSPAVAYSAFHQAIEDNSSHRPMLLSICNFLQPEQYGEGRPLLDESAFASYAFGPSVGNSWRTDTDVGLPGNVPFSDVLRNIDADAANPQAAGPGHWNDPDYLAPGQGMSAAQFDSQLSMWAMLAAPLMVSANLEKLGAASLAALRNSEVLAVDQDPAGVQGTLVSSSGSGQVWVKPLLGGQRAVALLNRGASATRIETSAAAVGLPAAASFSVRNLWTHRTSSTAGAIVAEVPAGGTVLLRVAAR